MSTHHVVIVGGGFGGVYTAKALAHSAHTNQIKVTLVDRQNYFLFTPLLHEVATGGLSPLSVTLPLREIFYTHPNVDVWQGEVTTVDKVQKTVSVGGQTLSYDTLVLATGARTDFRGVEGAEKHAFSLKTLPDAAAIRGRIIDCFEEAAHAKTKEEKRALLTFSVVGAGATGVEFAAELVDFTCGTLARYYPLSETEKNMISVKLIVSGPEVLKQFPSRLRDVAEETLRRKGVEIVFNARAQAVNADRIQLSDGASIPTHCVVWTAGVTPDAPVRDGVGGVAVDEALRMKDVGDVYVIGDVARHPGEHPMLAQVATRQAEVVARNIERSLFGREPEAFEFKLQGMIASLGQWNAVGDIKGKMLHGRIMWWLWRTVYLFKFPSWRKRIKVALEWTIGLFSARDTTKI